MTDQGEILFDRVDKTECPGCHTEIDVTALEPFSLAACPQCGSEFTVPARLANYRLLSCLGSGGMGSVYRAYDETLAREGAIKVMKKSLGEQAEFLESFRREAQAAAKLNHPNIAQIYSFGQEKGQPYIVMEYVPGKHLDDMIESPGELPQEMVMKIGLDIADGLQLATASNLIHGDIKPGNILMGDRDSAKLVDFGIASSPDAEQTEIWGTPYYISPEKIRRQKIDFRSDMYCLGGTLYHALTKKPPFDGEDAMAVVKARLSAPPVPLRQLRPDLSPEVERIVLKMLEADPDKRYPSYGELMADIGAFLAKGKAQQPSGATSKRIVIKSRGSKNRPLPESQPDTPADQAQQPGGHKNIRITRHGATPSTLMGGYGESHGPAQGQGGEADGGEPRKFPVGKLVAGIVVFIALAGACLGGFMVHSKNAKAKAEAEARAALAGSLRAACSPIVAAKGEVASLKAKIAGQAKAAEEIVAQAIAAVEKAGVGGFGSRIIEEKPFEFAPFDDDVDAVDGETAADAPAEGPAAQPAAGPEGQAGEGEAAGEAVAGGEAQAAVAAEADNADDEAAAGDADAGTEDVAAEEADGAEAAGEATQEVAGVEADDGVEALDGLPGAAREIFMMLAPVRRANALAAPVAESVEALAARAEALSHLPDGKSDAIRGEAERNAKTIAAISAKARERLDGLAEAASGLDGLLADAKRALDVLDSSAAAAVLDAERRAREEKAAEDARAEKERLEAEAAARKAAEEAEVNSVKAIVPAAADDIAVWKFDHVLRELAKLEKKLQFRSAQKALKVERRRVEGLRELKAFLVERLSSDDTFVHPRAKWSVTKADDRAVEIKPARKDAKSERLKWEHLRPEQIVPIFRYYMDDKDKAHEVPLKDRVAAYSNMAIYLVITSGEDANARELAKDYCERAIEDSANRRASIAETLYELDFGGGE